MRWSLLLLLLVPSSLLGQVVRGVVRDSTSGEPVPGVLVALLDRQSAQRRTALTDEHGRFSLAAPGPGSYVVETKRIGVRVQTTSEFTLGAGEARELSLTVAPVVVALLETMRVTGRSYCGDRVSEGAETATLWAEVRAALQAARITQSRRQPVILRGYRRTLHPRTFEVMTEERSERSGYGSNPVISVPAAQLSAEGYIVRQGGNLLYRGPDIDVLLSDFFVREHCFRAILGGAPQRGWVGLSFEPASNRRVSDISGVLWIDAETRELRRLEYRYTGSPVEMGERFPISYIDFMRLPTGGWIVNRWVIRMPQVQQSREGPPSPLAAIEPQRDRLVAIIEEGSEVTIGPRPASNGNYAVEGTAYDSSVGRPLANARVSLRGTPYSTTASETGRYRLQLPDTGRYLIAVEHPRLDSLGFEVPAQGVHVQTRLTTVDVAIPPLGTVRKSLCPGPGTTTSIVHGSVRKADGTPAAWTTTRYEWSRVVDGAISPSPRESGTFVTDSRGRFIICNAAPGRYRLTLTTDANERGETQVELEEGEIVARQVTLRPR